MNTDARGRPICRAEPQSTPPRLGLWHRTAGHGVLPDFLNLDCAEPRPAVRMAASIACGAASMRCLGLSKKLEPQINTDEHGCPRSPDLPGRAPVRPAEAWPVASHRWA